MHEEDHQGYHCKVVDVKGASASDADCAPFRLRRLLREADQEPEAGALLFAFAKQLRIVPDTAIALLLLYSLVARGVPPATDFGNHLGYAFIVVGGRFNPTCTSVIEQVSEAELLTVLVLALPNRIAGRVRAYCAHVLTSWYTASGRHTHNASLHLLKTSPTNHSNENVA